MPSPMRIVKGLTPSSFEVLWASLAASKPKTDDDYYTAASLRASLRDLAERKVTPIPDSPGRAIVETKMKPDAALRIEDGEFRLLERVFKEAREGGQLFEGDRAEQVVEAMKAIKDAEQEKPAASPEEKPKA